MAISNGSSRELPICRHSATGFIEVAQHRKPKTMRRLFTFALLTVVCSSVNAQTEPDNGVLRFIGDDYVAGLVARPARVFKSKLVTTILDVAGDDAMINDALEEIREGVGFDPRDVEEIAVLLDRKTLYSMARISESGGRSAPDPARLKNNLKQVGLAMHNFYDVYKHFPDHDGATDENKGNLSWRVHLLPYLDQAQLYNEFKLDEPWDSDHNKALIEKMPDVFRSPDVEEKGKTSLHGIVGQNTLFSGEGFIGFRDITDGTSNTIMVVIAGSDKADVWTKPGGVEFKKGTPAETLGNIGETFLMTRCDGSADALPSDMDADTFRRLVTRNDGEPVGIDGVSGSRRRGPERLPTWIVKSRKPVNMSAVLASLKPMGDPVKVSDDGMTTWTFGEYVLALPDEKTLIAAPMDLLSSLVKNRNTQGRFGTVLADASADRDLTLAIDLTELKEFRDRISGNVPMAGLIQNIESASASLDISGKGDDLQEVVAATKNAATAAQLTALLQGLLQAQKFQLMALAQNPNSEVPAELLDAVLKLIETTEIKADGNKVTYRMSKPEDPDVLLDGLKPAIEQLFDAGKKAQAAAQRSREMLHMKMIGLAFHNYHDVYQAFPRFDGDARPDPDKANRGLSWRVHLLPFLEAADLYEQFNLEEPWDSETNKELIERMPDIFKSKGVDKPGHTSIHVFIGDQTPFNDGEKLTRVRDFLDGTSNTILAVEAGADKAEIWTKPAGLKFTGENSIDLLGAIGESFLVLIADGSVHRLEKDIDAETLNNLIQNADGNAVEF